MPRITMNKQLEPIVMINEEYAETIEVVSTDLLSQHHHTPESHNEVGLGGSSVRRGCRSRRGRGRGSGPSQVGEERAREPRAKAQKKAELKSSKQSVELHRVLLPDVPPRKRRALRPSPEREPCELVSSSYLPHSRRLQGLEAVQPTSLQQQVLQADIEIVDTEVVQQWELKDDTLTGSPMEEGTEREVAVAPSTSICFFDADDRNYDVTVDNGTDYLSDLDMDVDVDDEIDPLYTVTARDASTEPAVECDLTPLEALILATEDRLNDIALGEIIPSDCRHFNWIQDKRTFMGQRETFNETTGPTFAVTDQTSVVDVFYKMIDSDFVDRLCTETNRYASQKIDLLKQQNNLPPHSRLRRWSPTDRDEMISFLALTILQGLYPLPEEETYFSYNGFGTMPYFARIMSYNRYLILKSMLHFVNNETLTERTKLCKIQPVMDYFNDKFSSLYYPSQEIVVDESLFKWQGRLSFAQKIKSKAAKSGVNTYELCDSSNGYLWKFFVHAGKQKPTVNEATCDETNVYCNDDTLETGDWRSEVPQTATAKIVYNLVEPLLHRGHTLIMDNLYNSPLLARYLKRHNTDCYGTLRLNREFAPESLKNLTTTDLRRGEVVATYCSDLSSMVWRDARLVSMISTYHQLETGTTQKCNRLTYKPNIVLDYNKSMGGVDKKNQMLSAQPLERNRNKVWYMKLFRRMFNVAMYNAYLIYATSNPRLSHRKFRTLLAEDLLKIHRRIDLTTEPKQITMRQGLTVPKLKASTSKRPRLEHRHFPIPTGSKRSRCHMCSTRYKKVSRTKWKCMECDINLCIGGCFMHYHID